MKTDVGNAINEDPVSPPEADLELVSLYQAHKKIYPRSVSGLFSQLALGHGVPDPARVLRPAVAGMGPAPDGAVRPGRPALLHLRPGAVPAGLHLPHRHAGRLRPVAVPVHRRGRAPVVRLRLPADGLHRNLPVDRAQDRGRPLRPACAATRSRCRWTRPGARAPSTWHGWPWPLWTGFTFVGYFTPIRYAGPGVPAAERGRLGDLLDPASTASPPTAMPASCASRSASTCARMPASRAPCSTRTR